jgi:hypothetical protein
MHFLISGIPASGKSTFCRWLEEKKGFLHLDVEEAGVLDRYGLATAWNALFDAGATAAPFVQALEKFKHPVAIDWGFPKIQRADPPAPGLHPPRPLTFSISHVPPVACSAFHGHLSTEELCIVDTNPSASYPIRSDRLLAAWIASRHIVLAPQVSRNWTDTTFYSLHLNLGPQNAPASRRVLRLKTGTRPFSPVPRI